MSVPQLGVRFFCVVWMLYEKHVKRRIKLGQEPTNTMIRERYVMERTRALAHDYVVKGLLRSRSKPNKGSNLASRRFLALLSGTNLSGTNKDKITFIQTLIALLLVSLLINIILYIRIIGLQDELLFLTYEKYISLGGW